MDQEFALRPTFGLDEQLRMMARAGGAASTVDGWFDEIAKFAAEVGTIPNVPAVSSYVTDEFMRRVANNPQLRAFATEFDRR
jgi:hypothetical protein